MTISDHGPTNQPGPSDEVAAGAARIAWLAGGNAVLLILSLSIARLMPWTLSWRDGLYFLVLAGVVIVRFVDITRYHGTTADGAPATAADWRRWALFLTIVACAGWFAAQSFEL